MKGKEGEMTFTLSLYLCSFFGWISNQEFNCISRYRSRMVSLAWNHKKSCNLIIKLKVLTETRLKTGLWIRVRTGCVLEMSKKKSFEKSFNLLEGNSWKETNRILRLFLSFVSSLCVNRLSITLFASLRRNISFPICVCLLQSVAFDYFPCLLPSALSSHPHLCLVNFPSWTRRVLSLFLSKWIALLSLIYSLPRFKRDNQDHASLLRSLHDSCLFYACPAHQRDEHREEKERKLLLKRKRVLERDLSWFLEDVIRHILLQDSKETVKGTGFTPASLPVSLSWGSSLSSSHLPCFHHWHTKELGSIIKSSDGINDGSWKRLLSHWISFPTGNQWHEVWSSKLGRLGHQIDKVSCPTQGNNCSFNCFPGFLSKNRRYGYQYKG